MSTISVLAATHQNTAYEFVGEVMGNLKRAWDAYHARRFRKVTMACLESLSDRHLEDIGLTRGQIDRAVNRLINVRSDIARGF